MKIDVDIDQLLEYYLNHSNIQTMKHFHIGKKRLNKILEDTNTIKHTKSENTRLTSLERYGVEYWTNPEKGKQTRIENYGSLKESYSQGINTAKKHYLEKYGTEYYFQTDEFKDKSKNTKLERYGDENYNNTDKYIDTCVKKYGVTNTSNLDSVKEKIAKSNTGKIRTQEMKDHQRRIKLGKKLSPDKLKIKVTKEYLTKKKNNSFNSSIPEQDLYKQLLKENVNKTIYRNYKDDERYPYYCDFYIKEDDLFIELNAHWTHGGHPFDETNEEDIKTLNEWKEKAKTSKFYKNAIETWTIRDVKKAKCAKENNLNYKVIY